jgi:uncharacterized repeat protein (TIGR01451 family)
MRTDHANPRWSAPRLFGVAAVLFGVLVLVMLTSSGGATAAVGPTDLSLTKSDSPDPVVKGNNLTYTIKVDNPGANDASAVSVADNLPPQVDFVSSSTTAGTCQHAGRAVTCDLGQVNAATNATVTIVVKAKDAGTISNTASLTSADDTTPANNSDTEATVVSQAAKTPKPKKPKKPKKVKASCATPTITGTAGDDVINGTSRGDVIVTFGGKDRVFAGGGGDLVCTGAGADFVFGDSGGDTVIGGGGPDRLVGADGNDLLKGKNGRDRLKGNAGNDTLDGGKKRDRCKGGPGRDTLIRCP